MAAMNANNGFNEPNDEQLAKWEAASDKILFIHGEIRELLREEKDNAAPSVLLRNKATLLHMAAAETLEEMENAGEDRKRWWFFHVLDSDDLEEAFGEIYESFGELIENIIEWDDEAEDEGEVHHVENN